MKIYFVIFLFFLTYIKSYAQFEVDLNKQRVTIKYSSDKIYNDSLLQLLNKEKGGEEIVLYGDSSTTVNVDLCKFRNFKKITLIGFGMFNVTNSECVSYLKVKNITILSKLSYLDFGEGIESLDSLIVLNAGLKKIPKSINKCSNITFLDLSNNEIKRINKRLKRLDNLKFLALTNNKLKCLPSSLLYNQNLEALNFESNQLTHISKKLVELESLKVVNLMGNKIESSILDKKVKVYY